MSNRLLAMVVAMSLGTALAAQEQQPPTPAPPPQTPRAEQPKPAPDRGLRPPDAPRANVRVELTVTDQTGPGDPAKKVVTMVVADQASASIRTAGFVLTKQGRRDVNINVDAKPWLLRNGSVQLDIGLQYQPVGVVGASDADAGDTSQTGLNERITTVMQDGKPMVISQAADPTSDRRITVEVKATVIK